MDDLLRQLEDKKEIRKQLNLQKGKIFDCFFLKQNLRQSFLLVSEQTMSKTLQKFSENRSGDQVVKSGRSRDSILRRVEDLTGENDNQRNEPVNKKQPKTSATSKAQSFMAKNLSAESTRAYSLLKVATGAKNLRGHEMEERRLGPSDSSQSEKDFLFHRGASSFDFEVSEHDVVNKS